MSLSGFVSEYYVEPLVEGTGYNMVNTVTYLFVLIVAAFLVYKTLEKLEVDLDRELWINLLPFVFLGGVLRALMDVGFFDVLGSFRYLFITPLIFFVLFLMAFIPLLVVHYFDLKDRYLGYFGLVLLFGFSIAVASRIASSAGVKYFSIGVGLAILGCFLTYLVLTKLFSLDRFKDVMNWSPVFGHSLDASSTTVAVGIVGAFTEQHVVPALMFDYFTVWIFIPFKLVLSAATIYCLDEVFSGGWNWILKFTVLVVGLGPGTRNILSLLMTL